MKRPRTAAYLLLLLTVLVWGVTFTLVKSALRDASPLLFNFMRFALATLALAIVNRRHLRSLSGRHLRQAALAGLFLALGYQLQTLGLTQTDPARSAFITGLVVIFVPALMLIPSFRPPGSARPHAGAAVGAVFAFFGLILLTTPAHVELHRLFSSISRGDVLTLLGALAFAAHVLALSRATQAIPSGPLATLQVACAAFVMLTMLPLQPEAVTFTPRLVLALGVCSMFATAAAFTIQSFAQRVLPPTHIVILLTLEPVFAWITSLFVLHQGLDRRFLLGALLILVGIAVVELSGPGQSPEIPA